MKCSLKYIFQTRYDPNRTRERKIEERLVPFNILSKWLSPYPTYIFLNLGIRPDWITFISFGFIGASAYFFLIGEAILAVYMILVFALLDSVDGDMARCLPKKTSYGPLIDSFGADIFYALIPVSVGYYLFSKQISFEFLTSPLVFLVGALASLSFIFYRLMNEKVLNFFWDKQGGIKGGSVYEDIDLTAERKINRFVKQSAKVYRSTVVRGNFFAEPGMIMWISIFVFFSLPEALAGYLLLILIYNLGYLLPNFVRIYISFRKYDKG